MKKTKPYDLFVIGGGINGAGIARDAAGRGYSVALAEQNDFASGTSSASTKLFHGGLRYLEFFEFRLVREALKEREILLKAMPHISWPMRFVLPLHPEMRFAQNTPTARLLSWLMPWAKGKRPAWLIRLGLFLYDNMGAREILPPTTSLNLHTAPEGEPLEPVIEKAFEYSDCWVEDSRLTLLNIRDAQLHGADIFARHQVTAARVVDGRWHVTLKDTQGHETVHQATMLINAGGPWVKNVIDEHVEGTETQESVMLVRGSHLVTRKLYDHDKCYFMQGTDGRIMFAIPYEQNYTLIGTTDAIHDNVHDAPHCTQAELEYMLEFVNRYFRQKLTPQDVVWTYSGVRPLYQNGDEQHSATAATRDYFLRLDDTAGAAILNIFGGKITTYRKLAESALEHINAALQRDTKPWTAEAALPGGDIALEEIPTLQETLQQQLPFLDHFTIERLIRQYGTLCPKIFADVHNAADLGEIFGHGVCAHEIDWVIAHEWVRCADDFLWRRSKMGLRFSDTQRERLETYIQQKCATLAY